MSARSVRGGVCLFALLVVGATGLRLDAHKPITSPYTFDEDVAPILRERCAGCHVAGGPSPMALTTAEETVPWGESIRLELVAGHMPPWSAMSDGAPLPHAEGLTARELNVLLTWVTGGAPPGDKPLPPAEPQTSGWQLGSPDTTITLPETTLPADRKEATAEFELPFHPQQPTYLRAVDLHPGTRSLVRAAQILVRSDAPSARDAERLVGLWVPGDTAVALPAGITFEVPPGGRLFARVRYKKTWDHERDVMTDRSEVGLYLAPAPGTPLRVWPLKMPSEGADAATVVSSRRLESGLRVVSVYPSETLAGAAVELEAVLPGGQQRQLIGFSPRPGWERRYTLKKPIDLPAGTRLDLRVTFGAEPSSRPTAGTNLLLLDVAPVPGR